ncbi:DnaJ domain-containing protein [Sediminitomix flava]|uniref:DnaJ-like protein n=1 Tax=Sediminitomix flava TaxID=379075 RepID=A0A315YZ57_SEDFL|nr:DnaJ domain-containing protein [Sediminitomix flava]PWJ34188.1 DnaJ-like protein [Sediminitomix flava]
MNADYYRLLGLRRGCASEEVKEAYIGFLLKFDQLRIDGELGASEKQQFLEIENAYKVLSDTEKRTAYDRTLDEGENG